MEARLWPMLGMDLGDKVKSHISILVPSGLFAIKPAN